MAEILSIAGILALAFTGKKLSEERKEEEYAPVEQQQQSVEDNARETITDTYTGVSQFRQFKNEIESFADIAPDRYPGGLPYYTDELSNPYTSGIMNNSSPVEKELVGPGLGVGPNVPAYGGYQQLLRVNPNNVGAYKLTTLPGRSGPAGSTTGGAQPVYGQINHKMPPKTAHLPTRLPPQMGRAQTQGGAATAAPVYGQYERSKRPTNRSEYTLRTDGLSYAPAKRVVSQATAQQLPTRNKGDQNMIEYGHTNNPTPGVNSFHGAYTIAPSSQYLEHRNDNNLSEYGLRESDRRGQADRPGNAGRMNVRESALKQGGALTAFRTDQTRVDGWTGGANGGRMQNYMRETYQDNNAYKGMMNPRATNEFLSTAHKQMEANPLSTASF